MPLRHAVVSMAKLCAITAIGTPSIANRLP